MKANRVAHSHRNAEYRRKKQAKRPERLGIPLHPIAADNKKGCVVQTKTQPAGEKEYLWTISDWNSSLQYWWLQQDCWS